MTHNIGRDIAILAKLRGPFRYLGLLGPEHRTRRVMTKLPGACIRGVEDEHFFNPVGLDLGAQSPEEIALSIVSEIQATLRSATSRSLRERNTRTIEVVHEMLPIGASLGVECSCPA